uniref:Uncharacterized protein n=1 Tax=Romanomermis culicivorax TaxID=13658 RepID=A0A915HVS8_ROMCU
MYSRVERAFYRIVPFVPARRIDNPPMGTTAKDDCSKRMKNNVRARDPRKNANSAKKLIGK